MNYIQNFYFDEISDDLFITPKIKSNSSFKILNCNILFSKNKEESVFTFCIDANSYSQNEAIEMLGKVSNILTYLLHIPIDSKKYGPNLDNYSITPNNSIATKYINSIKTIETTIHKLNKKKSLFFEILNLLYIGIHNLYKLQNEEDAFIYFFKIIEQISKNYYYTYDSRHLTKTVTKTNKNELKKLINRYCLDFFNTKLSDNILNTKTDLYYKYLKLETYGSIFGKISLFITKNKLIFDINQISTIIRIRNKIAHGDTINRTILENHLNVCEKLCFEMISVFFFKKPYKSMNIDCNVVYY